jgi:very-short-patch-repair endonuclease
MTDAERKLWFALRDRRFAAFKFRRQVPVGPYVADFLCYASRLIVEVDGGQHADSERDAVRDRWLVQNNFHVVRFWNNDVLQNLEGVLTALAQALEKGPSPALNASHFGHPLPQGERGRKKWRDKSRR